MREPATMRPLRFHCHMHVTSTLGHDREVSTDSTGAFLSGRCASGQDVAVYVAPNLAELERRIEKREKVWCGWERFLGGPDNECRARVTPFGESFIAVADHKDQSHFRTGEH